jgi:adenosylmethionine-8-amino-7-oxononanoate aminotransferase
VTQSAAPDLIQRDLKSVWHPFTQHAVWADDDPLVIDRADGMHLFDPEGRRYLDGTSSLWVSVHGHRVPEIDEAVRRQLDRMAHSTFLGLTHAPGIELAEELLRTAPEGLSRVFYAGDGSSAVEAAIKMAYQAAAQRGEDRPLYVHVAQGYHGDTLGAVSVGGIPQFREPYRQVLLDTRMVSSPGVRGPDQTPTDRAAEVVEELTSLLEQEGPRVCAVVVEPMVQAAGGMLTHDGYFLRGVRALCDQHGAAMIADEVATGLGSTGRFWAVEHADVTPDLLVCGKRLTGGYLPLSAVLTRESVYSAFLGDPSAGRTFFHGHTYTANPLSCAAALANLRLMRERDTVAHAELVGERIGAALAGLGPEDGVVEVRRLGAMTGIELASVGERTGFRVCQAARQRGVIIRPLGDVVVLMPPLAIGDDDLDELIGATVDSICEVVQPADSLSRFRGAAAARSAAGLRRRLNPRTAHDSLLDLASNDYLGLARDPRVAGATARAALAWGAGSTGSRLVTGSTELHQELETALANFTGAAAALVFSSGYLANVGALTALSGPDVLIVSDAANHASVIDGCRLSRSRVIVTPHCDVDAVEKALISRDEEHAIVVTDAVFSATGDLAPIRALHEVVRRHNAILVVDEAHSLGVLGPSGQGAVHAADLAGEHDLVRVAPLSKALGAQGGAVLAAPEVIDMLVNNARSFMFDTGLSPAAAGGALAALQLLIAEPELATRARSRAAELARALAASGLVPSRPSPSPTPLPSKPKPPAAAAPPAAIVPVVFGEPAVAMRAAGACREHGVHVGCFRPPSVPPGRSSLRLTARADLTDDDMALASAAFQAAAADLR